MTAETKYRRKALAKGDTAALIQRMEQVAPAQNPKEADLVFGNSDVLVAQWERQFAGEDIAPMTLAVRLRRIAMLLDEDAHRECERVGLKLNELLLLMALRRVGPPHCLKPSQILKMHSVTSGTATYRIDQLTTQGLAERINDPNDRRGYLIALTGKGLAMVDEVLHSLMKASRARLRPLTDTPGALAALVEGLRLYEQCISART